MAQPTDTLHSISGDGSNHTMIHINMSDGNDLVTYRNELSGQMISRELLVNGKRSVVTDSLPHLVWKFESEKKKIGSFMCQKATTTFRCANYVVWFTTDIPLSIGPWKLGGLPGLIVEATNLSSNFQYKLTAVEYPASKIAYPIVPPRTKNTPSYSFAEFSKVQQKEIDKMVVYLKSMTGNSPDAKLQINMQECYNAK